MNRVGDFTPKMEREFIPMKTLEEEVAEAAKNFSMCVVGSENLPDFMSRFEFFRHCEQKNRIEQLKKCLQEDPTLANIRQTKGEKYSGQTPLHVASMNGNVEAVRVLLMNEYTSAWSRDLIGRTPLHLAAMLQHQAPEDCIECCKLLKEAMIKERGIDPVGYNAPVDLCGFSPLGWAKKETKGNASPAVKTVLFRTGDASVFSPKSASFRVGQSPLQSPLAQRTASRRFVSSKQSGKSGFKEISTLKQMDSWINSTFELFDLDRGLLGDSSSQDKLTVSGNEDSMKANLTSSIEVEQVETDLSPQKQNTDDDDDNNNNQNLATKSDGTQPATATGTNTDATVDQHIASAASADILTPLKAKDESTPADGSKQETTKAVMTIGKNVKVTISSTSQAPTGSNSNNNADDFDSQYQDADNTVVNSNILFGYSLATGWRESMEDRLAVHCPLRLHIPMRKNDEVLEVGLFAVCDGHGGYFTAKYITENVGRVFVEIYNDRVFTLSAELVNSQSSSDVSILMTGYFWVEILVAVCDQLELELKSHPKMIIPAKGKRAKDDSGSTAVITLVTAENIITANVGDSRAVIAECISPSVPSSSSSSSPSGPSSYQVIAKALTTDHKFHESESPEENDRAIKAGATLHAYQKGHPILNVHVPSSNSDEPMKLSMSRAFGDFQFKQSELGQSDHEQAVIAVPSITIHHRSSQDMFVLMASDGVFDVMSNQSVVDFIHSTVQSLGESTGSELQFIPQFERLRKFITSETSLVSDESCAVLARTCDKLLEASLENDSQDNMCAVLIWLNSDSFSNILKSASTSTGNIQAATITVTAIDREGKTIDNDNNQDNSKSIRNVFDGLNAALENLVLSDESKSKPSVFGAASSTKVATESGMMPTVAPAEDTSLFGMISSAAKKLVFDE